MPSETYGTGQRLLTIRKGLEQLGECRSVWIRPMGSNEESPETDYSVSGIVPASPSRAWWIWHKLSFRDYRRNAELAERIQKLREAYLFDLAVCSFFRAQSAAPHGVVPCFLDADALPIPDGHLNAAIWPITRWMMRRAAARFEAVFVIRATDAKVIESPAVVTRLLPGISSTVKGPIAVNQDASNILFVGSVEWGPNRQSAKYLTKTIAPMLGAESRFKIRLVGRGTEKYDGMPNVSGAGYARDIEEEYRKAVVVVCPVWQGAGANIKLAEAVQYGCAVVATSHATSAFGDILTHGHNVISARDERTFASELMALLGDDERLRRIRLNAGATGEHQLSQSSLNAIIASTVRPAG